RRTHAEELSFDEAPLDLAPLRRGIARAVRSEPLRDLGLDALGREPMDKLRRLAAFREADRPQAAGDEASHQPRCVAERTCAKSEFLVEKRGVPERDRPLGAWRRVVVDDGRA